MGAGTIGLTLNELSNELQKPTRITKKTKWNRSHPLSQFVFPMSTGAFTQLINAFFLAFICGNSKGCFRLNLYGPSLSYVTLIVVNNPLQMSQLPVICGQFPAAQSA
jgi:hypothetical protein